MEKPLFPASIFSLVFILGIAVSGHAQWEQLPQPYGGSSPSIIKSGDLLFAGGGNLYVSPSLGRSWVPSTTFPGHPVKTLLECDGYIFAGTEDALYRTHDQGKTWLRLNLPIHNDGIELLSRINHTVIVCSGPDFPDPSPGMYISDNYGDTWALPEREPDNSYIGRLFPIGPTLYACGSDGVYRSTDNGHHWDVFTRAFNYPCTISYANNRFLITGKEVSHRSFDGTTWDTVPNPFWSPLCVLALDSANGQPQKLLIGTSGGYNPGLYLSDDDGTTWHPADDVNCCNDKVMCLALFDSLLFAGASGQGIVCSRDLGNTWREANTGITERLFYEMAAEGDRIAMVGSTQRSLFVSTDRGATWHFQGIPGDLIGWGINEMIIRDDWLFAATHYGLYRKKIADSAWQVIRPETWFKDLVGAGRYIYASTWDYILRSADHGDTWDTCNQGQELSGVQDLSVRGSTVVAVANVSGVHDDILYSTDSGEHFSVCSSPPTMWYDESPMLTSDDSAFYLFPDDPGFYRSTDHGASWENVCDTSFWDMTGMATGHNRLYLSFYRYGVMQSEDQGRHWRTINDGLPGTTVADIVLLGDTLLAAGSNGYAGFGLCRRPVFPAGMQEMQDNRPEARVMPNPASGLITILLPGDAGRPVPYTIYNLKGTTLKTGILGASRKIAVADLCPGEYLVALGTGGEQGWTIPFIIR